MAHGPSMDVAYPLPSYALRVLQVLEDAGSEAWVVGGWVRDALMGDACHDVDITCSALWEDSARVLRDAGYDVQETGTQHGTITVVTEEKPIEVTTFREDGAYSDHRHPDTVRFVDDVRRDLARRDLTINAMAYHPTRGLLDPFGGREDLAAGVIRMVGDPATRFAEDALRMLRVVRFACRMGFEIEERTHEALVEAAPGLADIAQERMASELNDIVATGCAGWVLRHEPDVLCAAIPELSSMRGFDQRSIWHIYDVMEHTIHVCNAVEAFTAGTASLALRWAALLHDVGKPACCETDDLGHRHFYGHPVRPTARSMRRTLAVLEEADPGNALHDSFDLMELKRADAVSKQPKCAWYAVELDEMDSLLRHEWKSGMVLHERDLAIGGEEVLEVLGIKPGPMVGMILSRLLGAVVDGEVENTREALMHELYRDALEQE